MLGSASARNAASASVREDGLLLIALCFALFGWIATSIILMKGDGGRRAKAGKIGGMAAVLLVQALAAARLLG